MDTTEQISVIVKNEEELEVLITELIAESVARADISVQGTTEQLKDKYGVQYIDPAIIQNSNLPPTTEPFLNDDFGWVVGFSFAIPLFICLILGIFIIGDIRSSADVLFYGVLGGVIGTVIGFFIARAVKKSRQQKIIKQERKGGYVLWITIHSTKQYQQVCDILSKYHLQHVPKQ